MNTNKYESAVKNLGVHWSALVVVNFLRILRVLRLIAALQCVNRQVQACAR